MSSNIKNIICNNEQRDKIYSLENNEQINVFFPSFTTNDFTKNFQINLKNNNVVNFYGIIASDAKLKKVNITINHFGSGSISNIEIKSFAKNKAKIVLNCLSYAQEQTSKNKINQLIEGILGDDTSCIEAVPALDINVNSIIAQHTISIGQLNPDVLFYLNTKGLNNSEAFALIMKSFINKFDYFFQQQNNFSLKDDWANKLALYTDGVDYE